MKLPHFLCDTLIRRKVRLHTMDVDRFKIRVARTADEYRDAFRLVHVGYVFQGIERLKELDLRITEQHVLPEATVLVAYEGDQIVGTISVTKDSPAGLPIDKDYPEPLDELRRRGAQISEIGSLAVVRRCWHSSLMPLLGMAAGRLGFRIHGSTHHVIGVHPKAAAFYRAIWGFRPIGPARHHAELDAPVVGLMHDRSELREHMVRWHRRQLSGIGVLPADYILGPLVPEGLFMPEGIPESEWPRFKMPREVFRELFVEHSNRLLELSSRTTCHLRQQRSDETLAVRTSTC
jgi:hypothetical protein